MYRLNAVKLIHLVVATEFQYITCIGWTFPQADMDTVDIDFNTSHVSVEPILEIDHFGGYWNFNTSHVSVEPNFLPRSTCLLSDFNTSHVSVEPVENSAVFEIEGFQYITCIGWTTESIANVFPDIDFNTSHVSVERCFIAFCSIKSLISIHHMYRLNILGFFGRSISCYFNTSHVSVEPNEVLYSKGNNEFQYITCIGWTSSFSSSVHVLSISIHHMYRLNHLPFLSANRLTRISIHHMYRLNRRNRLQLQPVLYFNTSHVSVERSWHARRGGTRCISIHHMYRLNKTAMRYALANDNFNTSHVSVERPSNTSCIMAHFYFNTSHVSVEPIIRQLKSRYDRISIHHMYRLNCARNQIVFARKLFQYITCIGWTKLPSIYIAGVPYFNTSHVSVEQIDIVSIKRSQKNFNTSHVSVELKRSE